MRSKTGLSIAAAVVTTLFLPSIATAQSSPSTPQQPAASSSTANAPKVLQSAAAAYAEYQGEVSNISTKKIDGERDLDHALDTFGGQNPNQLSSGWISYSALIASQNQEFAASMRDIDSFYGRDRVMTGMRNDVAYARSLPGGEQALQMALAVNEKDSRRISSAAAFVKDQAYQLQEVSWGKKRLRNSDSTVNRLKASSSTSRPIADVAQRFFATPELDLVLATATNTSGQSSVWDKVSMLTTSAPAAALAAVQPASSTVAHTSYRVDPRRETTANRIVTLAAFQVLEAAASHEGDVKSAMSDRPTKDCIDWSQVQLRACVSAAYTRADLSFCLAEHAIGDQGACFADVAN